MKVDIQKRADNCYSFTKRKTSIYELEYHIKELDLDDFYIFKYSHKFIQVSKEDFLKFIYCGYILFHKDYYNLDDILNWIDFLYNKKLEPNYLVKPFPPIEVMNKIKIIDKI